jgi:NADH-quinone oxidoreductase subunit J
VLYFFDKAVANMTFVLFYITLLCCSVLVVLVNSVKFSAVFLMLSFLLASLILILLGSEFLGLLLVIVYVGAVAILFLFAIMLTESKLLDYKENLLTFVAPVGIIFGLIFFLPVFFSLVLSSWEKFRYLYLTTPLTHVNGLVVSCTEINGFGNLLYSCYASHLLITGMLLLTILLGIFRLTNFPSFSTKYQSTFQQLSRSPEIF